MCNRMHLQQDGDRCEQAPWSAPARATAARRQGCTRARPPAAPPWGPRLLVGVLQRPRAVWYCLPQDGQDGNDGC